ncbi:coniferyl-alcohol dehydrogenase [Ensifer sp. B1-9]|uniref:coniferyl-alcohol dehydrogenase n=1 Tax=Ensifer sp. B1-9 TaxID=3141455 RepID=UPI003D19FAD8
MLYGKTVAITGVSAGIGARTAEVATSLGADVIGIDLNKPPVPMANFIQGDLSSANGVEEVARRLPKRFDALLNVAGISGKVGVEATLAINFYGLRALTEACATKIREGGSVVNVASIAGYGWRGNLARAKALVGESGFPDISAVVAKHGIPNEIGYPLSKELLLLWTQMAAHQPLFKDRSVRVNAVSPGPVETQILKEFRSVLGDEKVNSDISRVGRAGTASDIAPVILFMASDGARWINGANISNDGGLEASINAEVLGF